MGIKIVPTLYVELLIIVPKFNECVNIIWGLLIYTSH